MVENMASTLIKINTLNLGYKAKKDEILILENVNFSLREGRLYSVIGKNGSGKSTFLRTLAGIIPSLSGDIFYFGKNIKQYSVKELSALVACVFTGFPELGLMSSFDLVALGRYLHTGLSGKLSAEDVALVEDIFKRLGIAELIDKRFSQLSDGQKQKVMIARALAQESKVIILDEPTAFLDFQNKVGIDLLLKELVEKLNLTVIFSSHDINNALRISDEIILIDTDKSAILLDPKKEKDLLVIEKTFSNKDIVFDKTHSMFVLNSKI